MESGGQPGNQNAKRGADWRQAIKRALAHKSGTDYRAGLDRVAKKFVEAAENGDAWAMKELGDRMDGKAPQAVDLSGQLDIPMSGTVKIVRSGND
jgi:hypothetical protein